MTIPNFMASIKNIIFTIITVGFRQTSWERYGENRSDGSVSCIVFVVSLMGFLFPVLELLESTDRNSFELYFMLKYCFGIICLLSSVAWLYLIRCSRKQPNLYLDRSTSGVDPAANIINIFLLILSLGIIFDQGLNIILDITCYLRISDYHYLCSSINRLLEVLFCIVQTLTLIITTRRKFYNKLKVNYVLSTALLTNGILWMYTSLQIGKAQNNGIKNETLKNMACYVELNIYQIILSHTLGISLQTHLNYFLLCVGLTASTLPSGSSLADESDTLGWSQNSNRKLHRKKIISEGNKFPDLIFMFVSLASFLTSLVVVILQELTHPPDYGAARYLREWYLSTATCPMIFLIIAVYRGLHCIKECPIRVHKNDNYSSVKRAFKNDVIFIICFMGDTSRCALTWLRELNKPFLSLGIFLRSIYIIECFLQTVFLLTAERKTVVSDAKMKQIALFLCVGNLVLLIYRELLEIFTEHPSEYELIIFSLSSMNRFLAFVRSFRIYSISKCQH